MRQEYLLPSLVIGLDENIFWKQTPKTILIYFEADKQKQLRRQQEMWLMGAYVKTALSTTIITAGLADKSTPSKMPKYPDMPQLAEETEMTEERKEAERRRMYAYYKRLGEIVKNNNKG